MEAARGGIRRRTVPLGFILVGLFAVQAIVTGVVLWRVCPTLLD
jgi:hypothetical protein